MNAKVYDTLIEALQELQAEGYTENFELQKDGLYNVESDEQIAPESFEAASYSPNVGIGIKTGVFLDKKELQKL